MPFDGVAAIAAKKIFGALGVAATVTHAGVPVATQVVLDNDLGTFGAEVDAFVTETGKKLSFLSAEVPVLSRDDQVNIAGIVYSARAKVFDDGLVYSWRVRKL